MTALDAMLPADVVSGIRQVPEAGMLAYHDGLGRWIRNNWGLWSKGKLYEHLRAQGLDNPDEMSAVILTSFWRHLHSQAVDVEGQVRLIRQRPHERARQ